MAERPKLSHLVTQLLKNIEANDDRLSCLQKQPCFKLLFHLNKGLGLIIHVPKPKHRKTNNTLKQMSCKFSLTYENWNLLDFVHILDTNKLQILI